MSHHQVSSTSSSAFHFSFGRTIQHNTQHNTQPNQLRRSSAATSGAKVPLFGMRLYELLIRNDVHRHFAGKCTDLGYELGLSSSDVGIIESDYRFDTVKKCSEILKCWCQTFKERATPEELKLALDKICLSTTAGQLFGLLGYSGQLELPVETEQTDKKKMSKHELIALVEQLETDNRYLSGQIKTKAEMHKRDISNKDQEIEGQRNKLHALERSQRNKDAEITRLQHQVRQLNSVLSSSSNSSRATSSSTSHSQVHSSVPIGSQSADIGDPKGFVAVYNKNPDIGTNPVTVKSLNRVWRQLGLAKHWIEFATNLGLSSGSIEIIECDHRNDTEGAVRAVFTQINHRKRMTYRAFALAVYNTIIEKFDDEERASEAAFKCLYAESA